MIDFDIRKFGSTFTENKVNGFDIMIMQSYKDADKLTEVKYVHKRWVYNCYV